MRESTMPLDLPDGSERLLTPCLLLYPERVLHNLKQSIVIAGDASRLRPHVKTHKCPNIVQMALELGIRRHKCATLREAAMLAECGVEDVLIAYPMVGTNTARLAELVAA
ncbi:MAG: D-TA family PLP-dependent enzyme, partial [Planctomycetota bacterium]